VEHFVVDASMAIAWVHPSQASAESDAWLTSLEADVDLVVPGIWPLEVSNALLVLERRRKLARGERGRAVAFLRMLPTYVEDIAPDRVFERVTELAHEEMLGVYDACYLELALRRAIPLACKDGGLRAAAIRRGLQIEP
jgi:predicted nucleic acid-binding protein